MTYLYNFIMTALTFKCLLAGVIDNEIEAQKKGKHHDNGVEGSSVVVLLEPHPCQMVKTPYGCCWDKKTIALGPNEKGCPVCHDHKHMKCKKWKTYCSQSKIVQQNCPMSCGLCAKKVVDELKPCEDNRLWKSHCSVYKQLNFCRIPEIASKCQYTCGDCKKS